MILYRYITILSLLVLVITSCKETAQHETNENNDTVAKVELTLQQKVNEYIKVSLNADLSNLSDNEKKMISLFIEASELIDELFWEQAYGSKEELFKNFADDDTLNFININYGPWDRLNSNSCFVDRYGKKPLGANFYPNDIKYLQFVDMKFEDKFSAYTLIRRMDDGSLYTIPYHKAYAEKLQKIAEIVKKAASLSDSAELKAYLNARADALLTDDYYESDLAWMGMKDNKIDFLFGPYEDQEDKFLNIKAAFESYVLVKDKEWSEKLKQIITLLPQLQQSLPVEDKFKQEVPGKDSDIGVYEAIYYAGYSNSGGKSISINRPLDGRVQLEKGNRKLQFKNVQRLKFEKILLPIADKLICEEQRKHVKFEAFFINSFCYEIGEGLGVKFTVNGNKQSVKDALKEEYNTLHVGKAEVLRLFLATKLHEMGKIQECELMDNYVTLMANIFRSVRFGAGHAQGQANMIVFNYFQEAGAFNRNEQSGTYSVNFEKMQGAVLKLAEKIITIQGNGDYRAAKALVEEKGNIKPLLQSDLNRISEAGIPRDIIFEQGKSVLGL
jgi:hypothetical protein